MKLDRIVVEGDVTELKRRCRSVAAVKGRSLKEFVILALENQLRLESGEAEVKTTDVVA